MKPSILAFITALAIGAPGVASADEIGWRDGARAYALVVGSNPGGEGQDTLRFAERDAERVADVLRDLGGYSPQRVRVVLRPGPEALLGAIEKMAGELAAAQARGEHTVFFFYYSGHARASALNLGTHELPLDTLRERLLSLPSSLTVVVLDACQSGAFSRIKGAEPAADFSFNSVRRLDARGVAVMASSSGTELSQESESLGSSYFTHNLVVALRGAGDENRDGRVSLDEAYRYAYQATLATTARTAVGRQHVTLETDLKGKGEIPLTYPAAADSHIELPAAWAGAIMVQRHPGGAVMAEVHKRPDAPLSIALPHGRYRVLVHDGRDAGADAALLECDADVARGSTVRLAYNVCSPAEISGGAAKGGETLAPAAYTPAGPRWTLELMGGFFVPVQDAYTQRLNDFGFDDQVLFGTGGVGLGAAYALTPNLSVVGELRQIDQGRFARDIDSGHQRFTWGTIAGGAYLRGSLPLWGPWLSVFAQAGAGLTRGATTFVDTNASEDSESFWGYHVGAAAGIALNPWSRIGLSFRLGYDHAPTIDNLIGDTHDAGGVQGMFGLRVGL